MGSLDLGDEAGGAGGAFGGRAVGVRCVDQSVASGAEGCSVRRFGSGVMISRWGGSGDGGRHATGGRHSVEYR